MTRLLTLILLLFYLLFLPNITNAANEQFLFFDDFNDSNLDGWDIISGTWFVNNDNLVSSQTGRNVSGYIYPNTGNEWDNYLLELDVNNQSGVDEGIGFRVNNNIGNSYELTLRHGTGMYDTPMVVLHRNQNHISTDVVKTKKLTLLNNTWYHIKISVNFENIKVWIDDKLIIDVTDSNSQVKKGIISFSSWTGDLGRITVRFDNVKISSLELSKTPLVFIPGIGGSEFKSNTTFTSTITDCGVSTPFTYNENDIVWVNKINAGFSACDDYFDVLKLNDDGQTPRYPQIDLNGTVFQDSYEDIINFFEENGYELNKTLFIFPYDWRKNLGLTVNPLDDLINSIKQQTGSQKVDIVAHSMGGLVAKNYINDINKAADVRKLITLGTPYLGSVKLIKALQYGDYFGRSLLLGLINLNPDEIKDLVQNFLGAFELMPSRSYYEFYNNSDNEHLSPFRDDSDIDKNNITGPLNFDQLKQLLTNFDHNMPLFNIADTFHNNLDKIWQNTTNNVETNIIVGSGQPTLLQIHEQNEIKFHFGLDTGLQINKREEILGNGDGTVPLYSASLNNENLNLSGTAKVYYTNQEHSTLVNKNSGPALYLVKNLLEDNNEIPNGIQAKPFKLTGHAIIVQSPVELHIYDSLGNHTGLMANGDFETNIPGSKYDTLEGSKFIWLQNGDQYTIKLSATDNGTFDLKFRTFEDDKNTQLILYKDIPLTTTTKGQLTYYTSSIVPPVLEIDKDGDGVVDGQYNASATLTDNEVTDQIAPETTILLIGQQGDNSWYKSNVTVSLNAQDNTHGAGILKTEYSLDNGQTVQEYSEPFLINTEGITKLQVKSTDKAGNEEFPLKTAEIKIDKTPPETKIAFNLQNQDLEINGTDNLTNVISNRSKSVQTLTDEAGNITTLQLKLSKNDHEEENEQDRDREESDREKDEEKKNNRNIIILRDISYNNNPAIHFPENEFTVKFDLDKKINNIKKLNQSIDIKNQIELKANYNLNKNQTRIETKQNKYKEQLTWKDGIIFLNLLTDKGKLSTSY